MPANIPGDCQYTFYVHYSRLCRRFVWKDVPVGDGKARAIPARTSTIHPARSTSGGMAFAPVGPTVTAGRLDRLARVIKTSPVLQARSDTTPVPVPPRPTVQRLHHTGLPDRLKANVEAMSGVAMNDVRLYRNSPKPAQLQAHAFAHGTDIHLAPGQERHLPHEAWHVVQQKQGRVRPTMQLRGTGVNEDASLEREADLASQAIRADRRPTSDGSAPGPRAQSDRHARNHSVQRVIVGPSHNDIWSQESETKIETLTDQSVKQIIRALHQEQKYHVVYDFADLVEKVRGGLVPNEGAKEQDRPSQDSETLKFYLEQILHDKNAVMTKEVMAAELEQSSGVDAGEVDEFLSCDDHFAIHTIMNAQPIGARGMLGHHAFIVFPDNSIAEWAGPVTKLRYRRSQSDRRTEQRWQIANLKIAARTLGNRGQGKYFDYTLGSAIHGYSPYLPGYNDCFTWVNSVLRKANLAETNLARVEPNQIYTWLAGITSMVAVGGTIAYIKKR